MDQSAGAERFLNEAKEGHMTTKQNSIPAGANGTLPIKMGFHGAYLDIEIVGGPFDAYKPGVNGDVGVCVRAERVPATADFIVPIHDFSVPSKQDREVVEHVLEQTIRAALEGKRVYVGCMGGWGRTGLFLALIAKVCGVENPLSYVRSNYTERAVETSKQIDYLFDFNVDGIRARLFWRAWGERWGRLFPWARAFLP
jgi:hypothetical protein